MLKKRLISGVMVGILTVLLALSPVYAENIEVSKSEQQRQYNEDIGVQAYQNLLSYLSADSGNAVSALQEQNADTDIGLRDTYAGAFINEAGFLVVNVTDVSEEIQNELQTATADAPIQYQLVENSLNTLNSTYFELSARLGAAPYFEVVLSETNNTVEVYTEDEIELCQGYIADIVDISTVTIFHKANTFEDCATARAGDNMYCVESNGWGTFGFPCTQNSSGKKGFVTTAHTVRASDSTLGNEVHVLGKNFGTVNAIRFGNTVDAAFILKKQSLWPLWWTLKTEMTNGETIHNWGDSSITPEGAAIRKYGAVTGIEDGKILSNSASYTSLNGQTFYALTKTTMRGEEGDSGGPCIVTYQGKNMLVGILKCRDNDRNTYYCKINYIMKELNVTPIVADR